MTSWVGRRFEVTVGPVAHGGHCVARHEGRVVFVRHTLPGERVVVSVTEDRGGSFCRADAVSALDAAPSRVPAPCPFSGPGRCGGCDWQHVSAEGQRALKAAVVAEQLSRLAGVSVPVEVEELAGGLLSWRTRARLTVDRLGRPGFLAHRSHRVVPVDSCAIAAPGTVDAVVDRRWPPGASLAVAVDSTAHTHVVEDGRVVAGGEAVESAARRSWRVAADGFWQTHPDAADVYAEVVAEWSGARGGDVAWDLYAGVGLFASVLAGQVGPSGRVLAVESVGAAAALARSNLADLPQVEVVTGRVERTSLPAPRVVVLDPPRKGAGRAVVDTIASAGPERIVYVACDPAALARDVATFAGHGYGLAELRAFDAFPMTHHVECVALLMR
ncbi:class I SAM-dependent RNA methyltransferase [Actinophytocola gossypii]|uniref:Class I SAM-dependent RNA methyltransferase n=1 Tax=Actinophytocola gossypii TaxID=2812003 RepID=A0ABT2J7Y7_9PSEU|nr:class I SAM-dependent RNA methyltransferase [Actinophytocola gossypii]MCT2583970.1 class I SAM-dependent RNA methyltransferase [Actinophytocola gossypii]